MTSLITSRCDQFYAIAFFWSPPRSEVEMATEKFVILDFSHDQRTGNDV